MAVLMDIWMVILNELNITFIFAGFRADLGSRLRCAASMVNGERVRWFLLLSVATECNDILLSTTYADPMERVSN